MTTGKLMPFAIGETVVSIRDVELSNKAAVLGYDDRGFVIVTFSDGVPRALPVQSLQRPVDRKEESARPIGQGEIWAESTSLGDYLRRMGEAESGIFTKEKEK